MLLTNHRADLYGVPSQHNHYFKVLTLSCSWFAAPERSICPRRHSCWRGGFIRHSVAHPAWRMGSAARSHRHWPGVMMSINRYRMERYQHGAAAVAVGFYHLLAYLVTLRWLWHLLNLQLMWRITGSACICRAEDDRSVLAPALIALTPSSQYLLRLT